MATAADELSNLLPTAKAIRALPRFANDLSGDRPVMIWLLLARCTLAPTANEPPPLCNATMGLLEARRARMRCDRKPDATYMTRVSLDLD